MQQGTVDFWGGLTNSWEEHFNPLFMRPSFASLAQRALGPSLKKKKKQIAENRREAKGKGEQKDVCKVPEDSKER